MAAGLEKTTTSSADNEELAVLVKQAVAEAIKEAIPTLVEDVVSQLTDKTQALVDAQVVVFRGEMVAIQAEISKCVDYMEKDENRVEEVDSRLSSSVSKLAEKHAQLEDKIADMEDRLRRDNIRVHGVPENAETLNVLVFLTDAIPRWFPNLGPVEIIRAHRLGALKEDANGRPVSRTIIFKLLRFTDRDRILKAARGAAVEMEGRPIRFTPDYSPHTFRRRLAFSEAMDALQKLNFRTFLLYPAKLKVMQGGVSHFFNTPREHRRILWAGLTAAKKMLALRWQPPHSLAWQQWANSFLEIVLMEWSVARMHGANHKTLQGWEAAHKLVKERVQHGRS
ncbi:hypothetical protein D5F01_LYC05634 [Larimichthys crocea]|uniref:LINE-1 type transposase domain-containing protein 1 n=1 Tax=Larimichthys crocea TaxID=215358 RepID=A0A6G0IZV6_LARCR|nr:hypothetical protein D5F01_LYC05634 [Larimichthys crocea]